MAKNIFDEQSQETPCSKCDDCIECRKIIHLIVDCEACEEQMSHFKESISQCSDCMNYLNNHKTLLGIIKEKADRKCCPEKIASSILDSIKEIHT